MIPAPRPLTLALPFILNIIVSLSTDMLSYIHYVSLRWALFHEGRLQFNSNLRIFTSARKTPANGKFCNSISAILLVMSYTGASQSLSSSEWYTSYYPSYVRKQGLMIDGIAIMLLSVGLLGQVLISIWCLYGSRGQILSWSASPLNTALTCLHKDIFSRQPGRSMMPVHSALLPAQPTVPQTKQPAMRKAYPATKPIHRFLAAMFFFTLAVAFVIFGLVLKLDIAVTGASFKFFDNDGDSSTFFMIGSGTWPPQLTSFCAFLFVALILSFMTLTLHCAELLINVKRDELAWRAASSEEGAHISSPALKSATCTWQWWFLFILKPLAHWLLGATGIFISVGVGGDIMINFNPVPLFVLSGTTALLLAFATRLIWHRPSGPQPSAYGHLQTLIDLVDDWGVGAEGRLWWGAKGMDADGIGVVGTSASRRLLDPLNPGTLYH
ncbi:hypothetical protein H2198_006467 [Neophaeococcomyces mojaviensis]|uniref:Uncharacterized protein n=1 Tax=Neophaeococcomyces mojaviensis TaxID=3383035 RepID=A0ACC3A2U3_9EURO|nr:hypothetical protein H2198_006467 [Knufia sp. JES_112]